MKKLLTATIFLLSSGFAYAAPLSQPPSSTPFIANGTITPRTPTQRASDVFNVLDGWGGIAGAVSGSSNSVAAINAAIVAASNAGGGTVVIPAGSYYLNLTTSSIIAKSNVTVRGDGRGVTTLICDDTQGGSPSSCVRSAAAISNFHIRDLTIQGMGATYHTLLAHGILVYNCTECSAENIEAVYIRGMSISFRHSDQVTITRSRLFNGMSDGIAIWNTPNAIITNNTILGNSDDAISAHTEDADAAPPRSGLLIANNDIQESQGIKVLGGKVISITGNVMRRIMAEGIEVDAQSGYSQGDTPNFSVSIKDNLIQDVFKRQDGSGNAAQVYITVGGGPKGSSGLIPTLGTANTVGSLYAQATSGSTTTPGGGWFDISGNILVRTLPAVTSVSQWGYSTSLYGGTNGTYSGAIPESALNATGINISSPLRNSRICDNTISTTGTNGIAFQTSGNLDYDDMLVCRNNISKFSTSAIQAIGGSTSVQRMIISDNIFDADPMFTSSNRGTNGTWLTSGAPYGIYMNFGGLSIRGNHFRNMVAAMTNASGLAWNITQDNFQYGNIVSGNAFSTTNVGLASYQSGAGFIVQEDGNPNNATYGRQLSAATTDIAANSVNATSVSAATVSGATLQGALIGNPGSLASITITTPTGSPNFWTGATLGGSLPAIVVSSSNTQGGGATVAISSIVANNLTSISGGAGCTVGDTFSFIDPQTGGNLVGGGYQILTVSTVSAGSVTGANGSASSGNVFFWNKPVSNATVLAKISSTCTTMPTVTVTPANLQWGLSNNNGTLKSGINITASGAGYTALPNITVSPGYNFSSAAGNAFTTTLNSTMQISSASGNVQFTNAGTSLGIAGTGGAPVLSLGASIDASGVRQTLTSTYTVPVNTSLVRFIQTGTLAASTITLPTALADGQPIQFVNYTGTVTSLTFSPAVNGWTNTTTLSPFTGVRIRWDSTAAAWYREQ